MELIKRILLNSRTSESKREYHELKQVAHRKNIKYHKPPGEKVYKEGNQKG